MIAPVLVLAVGNPSRGDDALGPLFLERLAALLREEIDRGELELLTDFQLSIEHALDLVAREQVVFVDASVEPEPASPYRFERIEPRASVTATTHALTPAAVLATHRRVLGEPPESWLLAIRGERFELGEPLSPLATANLDAALQFFVQRQRGRPAERSAPDAR